MKLVINSSNMIFLRIYFWQGIIHCKHTKNNFLLFYTIIATFRHLSWHPIRLYIAPGGISVPHSTFALPALLSELCSPLQYMVTGSVCKIHQVRDAVFFLFFFFFAADIFHLKINPRMHSGVHRSRKGTLQRMIVELQTCLASPVHSIATQPRKTTLLPAKALSCP